MLRVRGMGFLMLVALSELRDMGMGKKAVGEGA